MPAKPAFAFSASQLRRISKAWSESCRRQNPRSRHSCGRLSASQARNSVPNCSSASLKLTSTVPSCRRRAEGEPNGILLRAGTEGKGRCRAELLHVRIRGIRGAVLVAALACGLAAPVALADNPVSPYDGGSLVQACYASASKQVDDSGYKFCRSLQQVADDAAAACRMPLRGTPQAALPEWCGLFDGREVSEAKVRAYEKSWVHRALMMQSALGLDAPLWETQLPHTHNSFNASSYFVPRDGSLPSYYPTLTNQDPN